MRRFVLPLSLILFVFLASACVSEPSSTQTPTITRGTPSTLGSTGAIPSDTQDSSTLTVMAAASLTGPFTEIGGLLEAANPGLTVQFNFAGSQQLAHQLDQGAPADVFASANQKQMDNAVQAGRIDRNRPQIFVHNRLVVVIPDDNPGEVDSLQDLGKEGLKIVFAAEAVPVGQYSLEFLDKASRDISFGPDFKEQVMANVVSYEDNVKAVLTKVTLGEADAGIVYTSDITGDAANQVSKLVIPDGLNVIAAYPIAVVSDSRNPEFAQAFVDLVLSPEGQQILAKYGFIPAAEK